MVKEEIVEGIKVALDKGQTLKDAMMSFFNAGSPREDINDAAREVLSLRDSSGNRIYSNEGKINKSAQENSSVAPNINPPQGITSNRSQNPFTQQNSFNANNFGTQNPIQQQNFSSPQGYPPQQQRNFMPQMNNFQQNAQQNFNQQNMQRPQNLPMQNNFSSGQQFGNQMQNQNFSTGMQNNPYGQQNFNQQRPSMPNPQQNNFNPSSNNQTTLAPTAPLPPTTPQKVSDYSTDKKSSGGKGVLFFFLFLFLLLITGGIVGLVFFKDQIFNFLGL